MKLTRSARQRGLILSLSDVGQLVEKRNNYVSQKAACIRKGPLPSKLARGAKVARASRFQHHVLLHDDGRITMITCHLCCGVAVNDVALLLPVQMLRQLHRVLPYE
eukprot:1158176-Pelagomonas_calceolata.AAC.3